MSRLWESCEKMQSGCFWMLAMCDTTIKDERGGRSSLKFIYLFTYFRGLSDCPLIVSPHGPVPSQARRCSDGVHGDLPHKWVVLVFAYHRQQTLTHPNSDPIRRHQDPTPNAAQGAAVSASTSQPVLSAFTCVLCSQYVVLCTAPGGGRVCL